MVHIVLKHGLWYRDSHRLEIELPRGKGVDLNTTIHGNRGWGLWSLAVACLPHDSILIMKRIVGVNIDIGALG